MITKDLQKKIDQAVHLLQGVAKGWGVIEIAYSGGKDSDVILQLAKEAGIRYEAVYKNTTIDPPGTIAHAIEMGATVVRPKETFFQLIERKGMPSRLHRFCCEALKEYKVYEKVVIGVRKAESVRRAKRYSEPTACRWFGAKKPENHVEQIYPILDWTDADVLAFVEDRRLKLAPVYYDDDGRIDVTRRLGCMCCPMMSKRKRIEDFRRRPGMVKAYIRAAQRYLDSHPGGKCAHAYTDAYEWFCREVFFQHSADWELAKDGLFGKPDFKRIIEKTFTITLKQSES
jgi:3'-phosphoadenosine 5'-phosphosulfate sulfotransferase (PAPS reductase)/FAD synthetase